MCAEHAHTVPRECVCGTGRGTTPRRTCFFFPLPIERPPVPPSPRGDRDRDRDRDRRLLRTTLNTHTITSILPPHTHRSASPAASPPPLAAPPPPHDLPLPPPPPGPPPPAAEAAELPDPPSPGPPGGGAADAPLPGPPPPVQPLPGAPPPGYFPPAPGFNPGWQARPPFGGGPPPPGYGGPPPPPTPQVEGSLFPSTGLPPRLAPLFKPRDPLPYAPPVRKRTARVGWSGIGGHVSEFASPGDGEHCPPRPPGVPASPRRLHNAEYAFQARLDALTPLERVAAAAEEKRAAGARARATRRPPITTLPPTPPPRPTPSKHYSLGACPGTRRSGT